MNHHECSCRFTFESISNVCLPPQMNTHDFDEEIRPQLNENFVSGIPSPVEGLYAK